MLSLRVMACFCHCQCVHLLPLHSDDASCAQKRNISLAWHRKNPIEIFLSVDQRGGGDGIYTLATANPNDLPFHCRSYTIHRHDAPSLCLYSQFSCAPYRHHLRHPTKTLNTRRLSISSQTIETRRMCVISFVFVQRQAARTHTFPNSWRWNVKLWWPAVFQLTKKKKKKLNGKAFCMSGGNGTSSTECMPANCMCNTFTLTTQNAGCLVCPVWCHTSCKFPQKYRCNDVNTHHIPGNKLHKQETFFYLHIQCGSGHGNLYSPPKNSSKHSNIWNACTRDPWSSRMNRPFNAHQLPINWRKHGKKWKQNQQKNQMDNLLSTRVYYQ